MKAPLIVIPLALEWVLLITTFVPLGLVGRFRRHPNLGIAIWLTAFLTAGLAVGSAIVTSIWAFAETYGVLRHNVFGGEQWLTAWVISFAPWLAMAVGGVSLALVNQKIEPLLATASYLKPLLASSKSPLFQFEGVPVATVELPFCYSFATNQEILISKFAVETLTRKELDAVLWHELFHVQKKHFALNSLVRFIRELTPGLAASRALANEIEKLAEIAADKFALAHVDSVTLANARNRFTTS